MGSKFQHTLRRTMTWWADLLVLYASVLAEASDDPEKVGLDLLDLLVALIAIAAAGLEVDHDLIQVADLLDHVVGRRAELAEAPAFGHRSVEAVLQVLVGQRLRFPGR